MYFLSGQFSLSSCLAVNNYIRNMLDFSDDDHVTTIIDNIFVTNSSFHVK